MKDKGKWKPLGAASEQAENKDSELEDVIMVDVEESTLETSGVEENLLETEDNEADTVKAASKFSGKILSKGRRKTRSGTRDTTPYFPRGGDSVYFGTHSYNHSVSRGQGSNSSKHVYTSELLSEIMKAVTNCPRTGGNRNEPMKTKPTVESVMHFIRLSEAVHIRRMKSEASSSRKSRRDSTKKGNMLLRDVYLKAATDNVSLKKDKRFRYIPNAVEKGVKEKVFRIAFVLNLYREGWFIGDGEEDCKKSSLHGKQRMHPYDAASVAFFQYIDNNRIPPYLVDLVDMLPQSVFYNGGVFIEIREYRPLSLFCEEICRSCVGEFEDGQEKGKMKDGDLSSWKAGQESEAQKDVKQAPSTLMPSVAKGKGNRNSVSIEEGFNCSKRITYLKSTNLSQLGDLNGIVKGIERNEITKDSLDRDDIKGFGCWDTGEEPAKRDASLSPEESDKSRKVTSVLTEADYEALMTKCGFGKGSSTLNNDSGSDSRSSDSDIRLSEDNLLELEKEIVNLTHSSICLNPSGLVACIQNLLKFRDSIILSNDGCKEMLDENSLRDIYASSSEIHHTSTANVSPSSENPVVGKLKDRPSSVFSPSKIKLTDFLRLYQKPDSTYTPFSMYDPLSGISGNLRSFLNPNCKLDIDPLSKTPGKRAHDNEPTVDPPPPLPEYSSKEALPGSTPMPVKFIHFKGKAGHSVLEVRLLPIGEYEGVLRTAITSNSKAKICTFHLGNKEAAEAYLMEFKKAQTSEGNALVDEKSIFHHNKNTLPTKPNSIQYRVANSSKATTISSPGPLGKSNIPTIKSPLK
eukprot:Nk52_evm5s2474 gene=Nk52_evmTU5s2474